MLRINSHALPVQTVQHTVLSVSARAKRVVQSTRWTWRLTHGGLSGIAKDYFCERTQERDRLNLTLDERETRGLRAAIDMSATEALAGCIANRVQQDPSGEYQVEGGEP